MNIRMILGFIGGAAMVGILWWTLQATGRKPASHMAAPVPPAPAEEKNTGTAAAVHQAAAVVHQTAADTAVPDQAPVSTAETLPPRERHVQETEAGIAPPAADSAPSVPLPAPEHSPPVQPAATEKRFFWKPFSFSARAEKFAGHISAESGVECQVEKTGVGRYQVYYLYEDEADRTVKAELIRKTGLHLSPEPITAE